MFHPGIRLHANYVQEEIAEDKRVWDLRKESYAKAVDAFFGTVELEVVDESSPWWEDADGEEGGEWTGGDDAGEPAPGDDDGELTDEEIEIAFSFVSPNFDRVESKD